MKSKRRGLKHVLSIGNKPFPCADQRGCGLVPSNQWQDLSVEVSGSRIRGRLKQPVIETIDETFKSGRVGLWTKADSVTFFGDEEIWIP